MLKRIVWSLIGFVLLFAGVLGVEIWLAVTRTYLPSAPAMKLGGSFGPRMGRPLTFVVLGDSTAAGLGAGDPKHAYATDLARMLAETGRRVELVALGVSGARVHDVLTDQVPEAVRAAPDLVFVGVGANDVTHLTRLGSIESDTRAILRHLEATGATIVLAGPPDMRARAWLEPLRTLAGWRGRQVASVMASAASDEGVSVVPLAQKTGPFFAAHPDTAYAADDFHPGPAGYQAWADAIFPALERALQTSGY
ncbi:MAG: SGNH/GDSL hydrolase family protein [Actinomycetota bacterium]|nr:SGNH/GDSL hydrolase family protein [Actinomycetota bacterium]